MTTVIDSIVQWFRQAIGSQGENNLTSGKTFEEQQNDLGVFKYDENGFTICYLNYTKTHKWTDITEINAYKKDLVTIDTIAMQIVFGDKQIEITEELPGWYQFVARTKIAFPSIPKDWDMEIVHPPFATNYTKLYSKENSGRSAMQLV